MQLNIAITMCCLLCMKYRYISRYISIGTKVNDCDYLLDKLMTNSAVGCKRA